MSDLTTKFEALEAQLATQAAIMEGYTDEIEAKLQLIADEIDTMSINAAANTKALLAALGQTGACFPCPTPTIVIPTIPDTGTSENSPFCKRVQAFVFAVHSILAAMDTLQSFNVIGTFNVLNDAISEIVGGIVGEETVPLPSFPETVNIVGNYISYAGERLFSGVGLIEQFAPLETALIEGLFTSGTVSAAPGVFNAIIDASEASNIAKFLFKSVGYAALYNYYLDPASDPDTTGYSGTVCGEVDDTCYDLERIEVMSAQFGGPYGVIALPEGWPGGTYYGRNNDTLSAPCVFNCDFTGYTIYAVGGTLILQDQVGAGNVLDGFPYVFTGDETEIFITCNPGVTAQLCGPDFPPPARA